MDSYDPFLHPSHATDSARHQRSDHHDHRFDRHDRDGRPPAPAPRSRHDDYSHSHSERALFREHRDHHRETHAEFGHGRGGDSDWRQDWRSGRDHHQLQDDYRDRAHGEYGYGCDARYTDDRYSLRTDSRDWERDRGRDSHHQHHVDRYSRRPQEENHRDRDRQRQQEPLDHHRHTSEYQGSDRHDSGQSRRPAARGADSVANNPASPPPPPPPSLQSLATTTAQPNPLPSPAVDTAPPSSGPPPLPSELHALAEQGPMLHQVEQAATKALSRQLPSSLMPDLLQDVDEILDLLLPVVLQSNQSGDVDQIVATLESRVKSQLKMARFTTKHLKTLREHPMLSGVLDPVIDSEVRRVAEGFKGE